MIRCQVCGQTNLDALHHCQRCGSPISKRIPNSLSNTWAFLIAAVILYIPANLLPMLVITKFEDSAPDTIFSGVVALINSGMVPIGLLVFVASILIPLIKVRINSKYEPLVTTASRFWDVSGIQADYSLWDGLTLQTELLSAILRGGIAFATPTIAKPAPKGMSFTLYPEAKQEWLSWRPPIVLNKP